MTVLKRVLFVCLGNICRSPMAEAIFRDLIKREGLEKEVEVDSAGTGDWHIGHPPHHGTRALLERKGISYEGIKARQIVKDDVKDFQYIIAMDESNMENMMKIYGESDSTYYGRLLDLIPSCSNKNVPDPYFTGNFDEVYELVSAGCEQLLKKIKKEHQL